MKIVSPWRICKEYKEQALNIKVHYFWSRKKSFSELGLVGQVAEVAKSRWVVLWQWLLMSDSYGRTAHYDLKSSCGSWYMQLIPSSDCCHGISEGMFERIFVRIRPSISQWKKICFVNNRSNRKSFELLSEVVNKRSNNADCRALCLHFIFSQFGPRWAKYLTNHNMPNLSTPKPLLKLLMWVRWIFLNNDKKYSKLGLP